MEYSIKRIFIIEFKPEEAQKLLDELNVFGKERMASGMTDRFMGMLDAALRDQSYGL